MAQSMSVTPPMHPAQYVNGEARLPYPTDTILASLGV
ncbi:MAG: hypothetical protein KatS3mg023_4053 [Armatimonadota bacterium]|jgi:hypothetical protein|nr:MAG: hypothetical protein KatS3mg023_4053 [Armatimonadota bacterium]GIV94023.1 MAG: hypothetical protein KatS3mg056_2732 [Chloroflexus sp.]